MHKNDDTVADVIHYFSYLWLLILADNQLNPFTLLLLYPYIFMLHGLTIGIPVPIVAISAGLVHDQYGHDEL